MNLDMDRIVKSPMVDLWASALEATAIFALKLGSNKNRSLADMFNSFLSIRYKLLLSDLALVGLPSAASILLLFYTASRCIRWFSIVSHTLFLGIVVHLTTGMFDLDAREHILYVLAMGSMGLLLVLYCCRDTGVAQHHPFLRIVEVAREHPNDFVFLLGASVAKAFVFVWFFSGSSHLGLGSVRAVMFTFFETAAMSSLMYNVRTGVTLLMAVNRSRGIRAYAVLMIRRVKLIGTICLAGLLRPVVFVIYLTWRSLHVLGMAESPREEYTLGHAELSLFYSILNDTSLLEGRRIARAACEDKTWNCVGFRQIPGLFVPCCVSLMYILGVVSGKYARHFSQSFVYLYFGLIYLLFLEFLYSVATVRSIVDGEKGETIP